MSQSALELINVSKEFRKDNDIVRAVDSVDLVVEQGEMVTFLGPSGCGKTTTLRMVAGFELPTRGSVSIHGKDMTNTPVNKRQIGFVFQNYALFPHMSVYNNVAYGLKARGESDSEIRPKVRSALALVGLDSAENRFPSQLSGGEQQRVALARVIVMEPALLLMDEPLSNLDAKLRIHMRTEIRRLQKKLGITCLYVTHDQSEALTMADRIVVMHKGKVEQIGTPFEIYHNPQSLFVADFIGQANIILLPVHAVSGDRLEADLPVEGKRLSARCVRPRGAGSAYAPGATAALIARPERLAVLPPDDPAGMIRAEVLSALFMGSHIEYELSLSGSSRIVKAHVPYSPGMDIHKEESEVSLRIDAENSVFLPGGAA